MDKLNKKQIKEELENIVNKVSYIDSFLNIITDYVDYQINTNDIKYPLLALNEILRNKDNILSLCYDTSDKTKNVINDLDNMIKTINN